MAQVAKTNPLYDNNQQSSGNAEGKDMYLTTEPRDTPAHDGRGEYDEADDFEFTTTANAVKTAVSPAPPLTAKDRPM